MALARQDDLVRDAALTSIEEIVSRSEFVLGTAVNDFERAFASYLGCKHVIGVSSGTDALSLSLRALELQPGDEVIVPAFSFVATAEAVSLAGATPVFADVNTQTLTIAAESVERVLSSRTRAVIGVHLYGNGADLRGLMEAIGTRNVVIIEDAAQAHGTLIDNAHAGTIGTMGCFSFYPTKNLGAWGDAGGVATDDDVLAARLRSLRHHGQINKHDHAALGTTGRLDGIQACVLLAKLPYLDGWTDERRMLADLYSTLLPPHVDIPVVPAGCNPAWHLYVIRCGERDRLAAWLRARRIETAIHYPYAICDLAPFRDFRRAGSCAAARRAADTVLSLPLYPGLEPALVEAIASAVDDWVRAAP